MNRTTTTLATALILGLPAAVAAEDVIFTSSEQCIACHSNLFDAEGNDVSIGHNWRATMMAHAAKDPYWHAGVRREVLDHPQAQAAIEDKCSTCHMPMGRTLASARGDYGKVFDHLQNEATVPAETPLALDSVSCVVCHQIQADNFGEHASYDGGFIIEKTPDEQPHVSGPYDVEAGRQRIMGSASGFAPDQSAHIQQSELCATCHTLITDAMDDTGAVIGRFPEQMPYVEWLHSQYREMRSCQDCHMPVLSDDTAVSSVLGEPRTGFSQHAFRGGNGFMLHLLNRYRDELGVTTAAAELEASIARTKEHLATQAAEVEIGAIERSGKSIAFAVTVSNLAGHKLPTAYPSRRAWLHVTVTGADGDVLFESGAPRPDGSISGNDNDADGSAYEPHYAEITQPDQVQIYEPVIHDFKGEVTTGLLYGVRYAKDNRLLPKGFEKATAEDDVAVYGAARDDADFAAGGDTVRYRVTLPGAAVSVAVSARLVYQPIGYRWAQNLKAYDAFETKRFVGYFEANAALTPTVLAETESRVR